MALYFVSRYFFVFLVFFVVSVNTTTEYQDDIYFKTLQQRDDEPKFCRYRNLLLPEQFFSIHADWGCYDFNRDGLFNGVRYPRSNCVVGDFDNMPCIQINENESYILFHHYNPSIQNAVLNSFGNEQLYERWYSCCEDALECCTDHLAYSKESDEFCPPLWDAWQCYANPAAPGEIIQTSCPRYAYSGAGPRCTHFSYKECYSNSTWNDITDYVPCNITTRIKTRTNWHIAMLSISVIVCVPALLILILYKQLKNQKYFLIRNLIIAIIIRNVLVLMIKDMIIMDELRQGDGALTVMAENNWPCKLLVFLEKLASNAVFTCMLLEGIYLHQLLTNVFGSRRSAGPNMLVFYICGGVISCVTAVAWAICIAVYYDTNCWSVTDDNNFHWINVAPRLAMLVINTALLLQIVWVMWRTFRAKTTDIHPAIRTAKAALICLPLFGFPFLFVIVRPDTDSCTWEQIYYFVSYALEGVQGVFVAILHCYIDREVIRLVKRTFVQVKEYLNIGTKNNGNDTSNNTQNDRRITFSTYADGQPPDESDYNNSINSQVAVDRSNLQITNSYDGSKINHSFEIEPEMKPEIKPELIFVTPVDIYYEDIEITTPANIVSSSGPHVNNISDQLTTTSSTSSPAVNNLSNSTDDDDDEELFHSYYYDTPRSDIVVAREVNGDVDDDDGGKTVIEPALDPKILFRTRGNGVVFLDPDEKDIVF